MPARRIVAPRSPSLVLVIALAGNLILIPDHPAVAYEQEIATQAQAIAETLEGSETKTLAVVDFTDLQGNVTELGRFLAEELSISLAGLGQGFEVVDRTHLRELLAEHKLSATGLIDPSTVRELGRIAGVDALVTGTVTPLGDSVRLAVKALDTESARVVTSATANIPKTHAIEDLLQREIPTAGTEPGQTPRASSRNATQSIREAGFLFQLKRCTQSGTTLVCSLTVTSEWKDSKLTIYASSSGSRTRLIDEYGNQLLAAALDFGSQSTTGWIEEDTVTGIPTSVVLRFEPLSPTVSKLALLEIAAMAGSGSRSERSHTQYLRLQFRDVPVSRE